MKSDIELLNDIKIRLRNSIDNKEPLISYVEEIKKFKTQYAKVFINMLLEYDHKYLTNYFIYMCNKFNTNNKEVILTVRKLSIYIFNIDTKKCITINKNSTIYKLLEKSIDNFNSLNGKSIKELEKEISINFNENQTFIKLIHKYKHIDQAIYTIILNFIRNKYEKTQIQEYFNQVYINIINEKKYSIGKMSDIEFCRNIIGSISHPKDPFERANMYTYIKNTLDYYRKMSDKIKHKEEKEKIIYTTKQVEKEYKSNTKKNEIKESKKELPKKNKPKFNPKTHDFINIKNKIEKCINEGRSLSNLVNEYDIGTVLLSLNEISKDNQISYYKRIIIEQFHNKRLKLSAKAFANYIFNRDFHCLTESYFDKTLLKSIINEEIQYQLSYFIETNILELKSQKDVWKLYYMDGIRFCFCELDFSNILSESLKTEFKMFIRKSFKPDNIDYIKGNFNSIKTILNYIYNNFSTKHFCEITSIQASMIRRYLEVDTKYSPVTVKKIVGRLSSIIDCLMNLDNYKYKPKYNHIKKISFYNIDAMAKNTDYIPNEVFGQIGNHINELNETYALIYKLLSYTGCRAKEIFHLQIDCSTPYNNQFAEFKYIPYKILNAKKRNSLPLYNKVMIPLDLHNEIIEFSKKGQAIRDKYNVNYLFAVEAYGKVTLPLLSSFCKAINIIIQKYNICDFNGELWNFTSKQTRKTLAVQLIEEGATPRQVQNQLGHLDAYTTNKYYAEVKIMKLAELNADFFKKKFNLLVGIENLNLYSEEERKMLYMDFCLNNREVEFGYCSKHISEGQCGKRVGNSNCATCSKLCTGAKYLSKWMSLRDNQQVIVDELIRIYNKNKISIENYKDFPEYKRELYLLNSYNSVLDNIQKGGE